jgi:hypothetical protein
LSPGSLYTGGDIASRNFGIEYLTTSQGGDTIGYQANELLTPKLSARYVEPHDRAWEGPFFYEDRRNVFYVTTREAVVSVREFVGYGIGYKTPSLTASAVKIPPVVTQPGSPLPDTAHRLMFNTAFSAGDLNAIQRFVPNDANIRLALGSSAAPTFQSQSIGAEGSPTVAASTAEESIP